jgi:hypothetical protein
MSRIVLSVWDQRISPVFESCSQLLVAETGRWPFECRVFCSFAPGEPEQNRAFRAMDTGARTLICGAISRMYLNMIAASSMEVIPFVTGEVNDILRAYSQQRLNLERFGLPGCRKHRRRQRGRGRGSW